MTSIIPDYMTVAHEIQRQLGGSRFKTMTGASGFGGSPEGRGQLSFRLPRALKGINAVYITLTEADTYTLKFCRIARRGGEFNITTKETCEDIYAENLQDCFTRVTGLYTHL
jgi:phage FluMu protein Com